MTKKEHDKIVKGYVAVIKNKEESHSKHIKIAMDAIGKQDGEIEELKKECGRYIKTIEDQLTEITRIHNLYGEYYGKYTTEQEKVAEAHKKVGLLKIQVSNEQVKYDDAIMVFADIIKELK